MTERTCFDCGKPITASSKLGRCRSCAMRAINRDPAIIARREATNAALRRTPEFRARHSVACAEAKRKLFEEKPEALERVREAGRTYGARNLAAGQTRQAHAKRCDTLRRRALAWCPEEYWPLNQKLKRAGVGLAERQRLIADQAKHDERRRLATLTPLERQLERLRNGARLVEKPVLPSRDHGFTLGGVASGLL